MRLSGFSHFGSAYVLGCEAGAVDIEEWSPEERLILSSSELGDGGHCIRALGHRAYDLELAFGIAARLIHPTGVAPVSEGTSQARAVAATQA